MKFNRQEFIKLHDAPKFQNNYNIVMGVNFSSADHLRFDYCGNNKKWLAFSDGMEIGELTEDGIKYAESKINKPEEVKKRYA